MVMFCQPFPDEQAARHAVDAIAAAGADDAVRLVTGSEAERVA